MVIKAHANYRPFAQPVTNILLDNYPNAAAAYSLRKLRTAYTGAAIRVRKDTTGQPEQDIGFTASGDLDTAALKSFLNARSGFVTTWYDQSGNGRNATQSTQANQPRIALNGVVDRRNDKPTLDFIGTNFFRISYYDLSSQWYAFATIRPNSTAATQRSIYSQLLAGGNIGQIYLGYGRSSRQFLTWYNAYLSNATNAVTTNLELQTFFKTGSTSNWSYGYFTNGAANGSFTNTNNAPVGTVDYQLGALNGGTNIDAKFSEFVIYNSNQSSNRTGIESNINTYYGIY